MRQYLHQLVGRFKNLPVGPDQQSPSYEEAKSIVEKASSPGDRIDITWDDVYRLDLALVRLEPFELVRRRKLPLEAEYEALVSAQEFQRYKDAEKDIRDAEKDIRDAEKESIRANLQNLMHEVQAVYNAIWAQEDVRRKHAHVLVESIIIFLLVDLAAAVSLGYWYRLSSFISIAVLIVLTGALGALTSTLRRVQTMDLRGNPHLNMLDIARSSSVAFTSAVLGAVFSVLLYLLFAGGLLKGALFPEIAVPESTGATTITEWDPVPHNTLNYAKLLVWAFIAGFAERLVPDRLDQLSKTGETQEKTK
jgi:hypothetical protein